MFEKFENDNGNNSVVPFNFIVHEPKGIIESASDRSFFSNCLMYLSNFVSEW